MKTIILSPRIVIDKHNKINFLVDEDMSNFLNKIKVNIVPLSLKKKKIEMKEKIVNWHRYNQSYS